MRFILTAIFGAIAYAFIKKGTAMQLKLIIIALISITVLGCATYKTTLTNAQGESVTCEASGKNGLITGYYLRKGFEDCISAAKDRGFKETTKGENQK